MRSDVKGHLLFANVPSSFKSSTTRCAVFFSPKTGLFSTSASVFISSTIYFASPILRYFHHSLILLGLALLVQSQQKRRQEEQTQEWPSHFYLSLIICLYRSGSYDKIVSIWVADILHWKKLLLKFDHREFSEIPSS